MYKWIELKTLAMMAFSASQSPFSCNYPSTVNEALVFTSMCTLTAGIIEHTFGVAGGLVAWWPGGLVAWWLSILTVKHLV